MVEDIGSISFSEPTSGLACSDLLISSYPITTLSSQSPASRNDFCRMLAQEGLLEPLSTALISVVQDTEDEFAESAQAHILHTFLIYSQSDSWLKKKVATRGVLRSESSEKVYVSSSLLLDLHLLGIDFDLSSVTLFAHVSLQGCCNPVLFSSLNR